MTDKATATARTTARKSSIAVEPLVVRPAEAWRMLNVGATYGYELLEAGELDSYLDGGARKITVESIKARIARRLAASKGAKARKSPRSVL